MLGFADLTHHGEGAALALAQGFEVDHVFFRDAHHVALLALIAPEFHGRHAALGTGDIAKLEVGPSIAVVNQFGQGVGEPAGPHIMDGNNRVVLAARRAPVDHLLAAALEFGVLALDRGEVEVFVAGTGRHG